MIYPTISEYIEAIKSAEDNFEELKHLRPVWDGEGEPVMTSGNFAVVFKMKDEQTGKLHAVKCFLKEQEGRSDAYRLIAEELEYVNSTFLTPIRYLEKELFVDTKTSAETEFPVLLMDWVEGLTLDKYIREHIDDQYELSLLAYQFSRLAMWLMPQPFAHGDLKPDNILVKDDGTLVLVDYDGMYVPAMKGQKARELGSPDFRHPARTEDDFDEHIDDFSLASILLSLKAIALQPSLLEQHGASDRLLFSANDYRNLSESKVLDALKPLMQDAEFVTLYALSILAISQKTLSQVSFRLLYLSRPDRSLYEEENLSTVVTEEDLANAWVDAHGVKYSADKKRLLRVPRNMTTYSIREGTKVIADEAFAWCKSLTSIHIPDNVTSIGEWAFEGCESLISIHIPDSVTSIGEGAFSFCSSLTTIHIPDSVTSIGESAFSECDSLTSIHIPDSVTSIGEWAFWGCSSLTSIHIPDNVTSIGEWAFDGCESLTSIMVHANNNYYDSRDNCNAIIETKSNTLIQGCNKTVIPDSVTSIGEGAFYGYKSLTSIHVPDSVTSIGERAFSWCRSLTSIHIPASVTSIGESAFWCCESLTSIHIPDSVTSIGERAFLGCDSLTSIHIPDSVTSIGKWAFSGCKSLTTIHIPDSVTSIGGWEFSGCESLASIVIPRGTRKKFEVMLSDYKDKLVEQ